MISKSAARPKLSPDDPCLKAMNRLADAMKDMTRLQQLHAMSSAAAEFGYYDIARQFLNAAEDEALENADDK